MIEAFSRKAYDLYNACLQQRIVIGVDVGHAVAHVALVGVPSLPFEVSDLEALRAIADQITGDVVKA